MTGSDPRGGRDSSPGNTRSEDDLSGRLKRLGSEIDARRPAARTGSGPSASAPDPSSLGRAMRASTEFVAGVIAGGLLGWLIDRGLGTRPWGMIVFLLLGFAAGIYNVMRSSGFLTTSSGVGGAAGRQDK